MEQFGATVNPSKCQRVHLLVVASCLPLRDGCAKDLPRTSDDIYNVNASGNDDAGYKPDKRCVILSFIKEESENNFFQIAAGVVILMRRKKSARSGEGLRLWTQALACC